MIHRALLGSIERFFGILIEHYSGDFPPWLASTAAKVLPLSEKFVEYGQSVVDKLRAAGVRAILDDSDEKLGYKIRRAEMEKVPYALIVGGREEEAGAVGVRKRKEGDLGAMPVEAFVERVKEEISSRKK
jgi:threonyl-tRNA synthetase